MTGVKVRQGSILSISCTARRTGDSLLPPVKFWGTNLFAAPRVTWPVPGASHLQFPLERKDWTELGPDVVPLPSGLSFVLGESGRVQQVGVRDPRAIHGFLQHE